MNSTPPRRAVLCLALLAFAPGLTGQSAGVETITLNRPLRRAFSGNYGQPRTSQDGKYIVYRAQPGNGTSATRVRPSDARGEGLTVAFDVLDFTPDSLGFLAVTDVGGDGAYDFARFPVDGNGPPRILMTFPPGRGLAPYWPLVFVGKEHVLVRVDLDTDEVFELYRVTLADGTAVKLDAPLAAGERVGAFQLSSDELRVVFSVGLDDYQGTALFSAPTDGSSPAASLPITLESGDTILYWSFSSPLGRVVYLTGPWDTGPFELHSVEVEGAEPEVELSPPLDPGETVGGYSWSSDGQRVLFSVLGPPSSDPIPTRSLELFSVPADGSSAATSYFAVPDFDWQWYLFGDWSVFLVRDSAGTTLLGVPSDGSPPRVVAGPLSSISSVQRTGDGQRVVFTASELPGRPELFSAPVDGSSPAVRLSGPLATGGSVLALVDVNLLNQAWETNAGIVFLVFAGPSGPLDLFLTPADGSRPARRLASGVERRVTPSVWPLHDAGWSYQSDFGRVFFERLGTLTSIGLAEGSEPVELEHSSVSTVVGAVQSFDLSAAGERAVYLAQEDGEASPDPQLRSVSTGERSERVSFTFDPLDRLESVTLSPDDSLALVIALRGAERLLYSVPVTGGVPVRLSGPDQDVASPIHVSPQGTHVAYFARVGTRLDLFVAPIEGGAPAVRLSAALPFGVSVGDLSFSSDGSRVAFRSNERVLHTAYLDGVQPAVAIGATHEVEGDYRLSGDGTQVFFRTSPAGGRQGELYVAPTDASASPRRLSGPLPTGQDVVEFAVSRDASRAFYRAAQDVPRVVELYAVPTDGSSPPAKMHAPLTSSQDVMDFRLSGDDRWVVFRADLHQDNQLELFSVPTDLGAAPKRLNGPLTTGGQVIDYELSPDSSRVVFRADASVDGREELFSVPIRGARAPTRLRNPVHPSGRVHRFRIGADSRSVAFIAERPTPQLSSLLTVGIGGGKALELTAPFLYSSSSSPDVFRFELGPGGRSAAYRSSPNRGVDLRFAHVEPRSAPGGARLR